MIQHNAIKANANADMFKNIYRTNSADLLLVLPTSNDPESYHDALNAEENVIQQEEIKTELQNE